jgi:hypothetical protein
MERKQQVEERRAGTVDQRADEPNKCSSDVVIWRKSDTLEGRVYRGRWRFDWSDLALTALDLQSRCTELKQRLRLTNTREEKTPVSEQRVKGRGRARGCSDTRRLVCPEGGRQREFGDD